MSTTPLLDLAPIRTALDVALVPALAREVTERASTARADGADRVAVYPRVVLVALRTQVSGPQGLGHGRTLTEQFGAVVQVQQLAGDDAAAADALLAIRRAIFAALEGHPPAAGWSPIRYQGGRLLAHSDATLAFTWADTYSTQAPVHELRGAALGG